MENYNEKIIVDGEAYDFHDAPTPKMRSTKEKDIEYVKYIEEFRRKLEEINQRIDKEGLFLHRPKILVIKTEPGTEETVRIDDDVRSYHRYPIRNDRAPPKKFKDFYM